MISKKIIALFLAFAIGFSLCVYMPITANAAGFTSSSSYPSGSDLIRDGDSISARSEWMSNNRILTFEIANLGITAGTFLWRIFDEAFGACGVGSCCDLEVLTKAAISWNNFISRDAYWPQMLIYCAAYLQNVSPWAEVVFDSSMGVYRLQDSSTGLWLVNSAGHFPYYRPDTGGSSGSDPEPEPEIYRTGQWLNASQVATDSVLWHVATNYELLEFRDQWLDVYPNAKLTETTNYYWLTLQTPTATWVLCDKYGYPYYLPKPNTSGLTTENNYYSEIENTYTDDDTIYNILTDGPAMIGSPVDINNGIINVGGEILYIDNLVYDASTQTYYIDAHDDYTYNNTTNNYVTNNYQLTIQYHVTHTSITYIGQTEEYDKRYELYYELPDGRSSADLTAEDLEQLSTVFHDVIQYQRTADNANQRALYHFDGNTEDSSYWSYCSTFDWDAGASLTYMDEGTFGGSLYLDALDHDFTISLPGNDAAGDWTLQFRYYQSHTEAPLTDSYLMVGSDPVMYFDGANYYTGFNEKICATSVGSWNEICIMRVDGWLHYYINGVYMTAVEDHVYHGNTIRFVFGSRQQTYKKLDELRFTSAIVYTPGKDYLPSSVPFDSNLALILPENGNLLDQGVGLIPAEDNLLADVGLDDWTSNSVVGNLYTDIDAFKYGEGVDGCKYPDVTGGPYLISNPDHLSFDAGELGTFLTFRGLGTSYGSYVTDADSVRHYYPTNCLFIPLAYVSGSDLAYAGDGSSYGIKANTYYTLSVVLADGSYTYATFMTHPDKIGYDTLSWIQYEVYSPITFARWFIGCGGSILTEDSSSAVGFAIRSDQATEYEIIYMELVEGTQPQFEFFNFYSNQEQPEDVILDEFVQVSSPIGNILGDHDLADFSSDAVYDRLYSGDQVSVSEFASSGSLMFNAASVSVIEGTSGVAFDLGGTQPNYRTYDTSLGASSVHLKNSLFFPIRYWAPSGSMFYGITYGQEYTFTVVLSDGTSTSITFTYDQYDEAPTVVFQSVKSVVILEPGYVGSLYDVCNVGFFIYSEEVSEIEIIYMELVEGSEPLHSVSKVTSIYSAEDLTGSPILAVKTNCPITGYQIGGVRPSYPMTGQVYAMVENHRIVSLQQYTGSAWEAVDGRIWTGERWIPCSSYDVMTMKDFYDVSGGTSDDYEYIYTESGFWAWFQKQWIQLMEKIDKILAALNRLLDKEGFSDNGSNTFFDTTIDLIFHRKDDDGESVNRVSNDDISVVGNILDKLRSIFDTGYKPGDIFSITDGREWISWFSIDVSNGLDSVNSVAPVGDEDPYNHHYYYNQQDYLESFKAANRGGD